MGFVIFAISMALLIYGANLLVKESEKLALHFGISPFVIGASLIALGTSLPEMAASISASLKGSGDIAVSNVVGSNLFNITLVLGVVFLFAKKIEPDRNLFFRDSAWMLFPLLIFMLMALDGVISRYEGVLLLVLMGAYIYFLVTDSRELIDEPDEEIGGEKFGWFRASTLFVAGFALVIFGAHFAIDSATVIARDFGISEWIIGMFLVSIGTSLPELIVSIVAIRNNNADMSIGNIIGSNVSNITVVLGAASITAPIAIDIYKNSFDLFALGAATLMLMFITANKLYNKSAGVALLILLLIVIDNAIKNLAVA